MATRELSPREEEIIQLCVEGLRNDAIAYRLGLSVGTVNTYWLRIKLKVGGSGRTDTVAKIIKARAERALRDSNALNSTIEEIIAEKAHVAMELRAALALLNLAMDQIKSTVWATDSALKIDIIANGEFASTHFGVVWEVGKTVQEIFKTTDRAHPAIAAHLGALQGLESEVRLTGEFANLLLHVSPLYDESNEVMACISILNSIGSE